MSLPFFATSILELTNIRNLVLKPGIYRLTSSELGFNENLLYSVRFSSFFSGDCDFELNLTEDSDLSPSDLIIQKGTINIKQPFPLILGGIYGGQNTSLFEIAYLNLVIIQGELVLGGNQCLEFDVYGIIVPF